MRKIIAALASIAALTAVVTAQTGSLHQNGVIARYNADFGTGGAGRLDVSIYVEVDSTPGQNKTADLYVYAVEVNDDWTMYRSLYGTGPIPASYVKITGTSVSVNIPDLRQLGPAFFFWSGDYTNQGLNVTLTATSDWQDKGSGTLTIRTPQPDGTVAVSRQTTNALTTSASAQGTMADYDLATLLGSSAEIERGSYRSHIH